MSDNTLPQELSAEYPERLLAPVLNYNLALDVALGVDTDTLLDVYELQHHELQSVKQTAVFQQQLSRVEEDLAKAGGAFQLKAKAQAEELLKESFRLALDPDVSATVRADMIKQQVRWAGFDAPKSEGAGGDEKFSITINLGNSPENENSARVINQEGS